MTKMTVLAALVLAFGAAGCGEKVLDQDDAQSLAQQAVGTDPARGSVSESECPDDIEPKNGESFDCTVTTDKGSYTVTIEMSNVKDDGASLEVTDIKEG